MEIESCSLLTNLLEVSMGEEDEEESSLSFSLKSFKLWISKQKSEPPLWQPSKAIYRGFWGVTDHINLSLIP